MPMLTLMFMVHFASLADGSGGIMIRALVISLTGLTLVEHNK